MATNTLQNAREALQAMRNLGVPLNDHDSAALDTLCDFAESTLTAASAEAATPVTRDQIWNVLHRFYRDQLVADTAIDEIQALFSAAPQASQPIGQPSGDWMKVPAEAVELIRDAAKLYEGEWDDQSACRTAKRLLPLIDEANSQPVSGAMTDKVLCDAITRLERLDSTQEERFAAADGLRSILSASGQAGQSEVAEPTALNSIERYRLQMAAISTAAIGYWKEGDSILPDYDTPALRDVAKLYAKYAALSSTPAQQTEDHSHEKDNCQFCLGAKGGVRGNENNYNGIVVCDYCTCLMNKAAPQSVVRLDEQTEAPVNVPSGFNVYVKHNRVFFSIGNQSFMLAYQPEDEPDMSAGQQCGWFMKQLRHALSRLAAAPAPVQTEAQQTVFDRVILPEAQQSEKLSFDDALRIAKGCTDYGGGHRSNDEHFGIYQHGIQTVINALESAVSNGMKDTQVRALHNIGSDAIAKEKANGEKGAE